MAALQININASMTDFSAAAKAELTTKLQTIAGEVIDEASRLEQARRTTTSGIAEVTASHVEQAESFLRGNGRGPEPQGLSTFDTFIALTAALSAAAAGSLSGMLNSVWQGILFGVAVAAAVPSTYYTIRRGA